MRKASLAALSGLSSRLAWVGVVVFTFFIAWGAAHAQQAEGVRFAVIGDYGMAGPAEQDVAALVRGWNPDVIITVGDNNYENG